MNSALLSAFFIFAVVSTNAFAKVEKMPASTEAKKPAKAHAKVLRVGGKYRVQSVNTPDQVGEGHKIVFTSTQPTGRFDKLLLVTDDPSFLLKKGDEIRLDAEVLRETKKVTEVSQVKIHVPGQQGAVPVFMISKKSQGLDLRSTKLLDMHAPTADYLVY